MAIERGKVVTFHYRLRDDEGEEIESSEGKDPAAYLHGRGSIVPGLESEMRGHEAGDRFTATITPEHAYGMYDPEAVGRIPIKHLIKPGRLTVGKAVAVNTKRGPARAIVTKVGRTSTSTIRSPAARSSSRSRSSTSATRRATSSRMVTCTARAASSTSELWRRPWWRAAALKIDSECSRALCTRRLRSDFRLASHPPGTSPQLVRAGLAEWRSRLVVPGACA